MSNLTNKYKEMMDVISRLKDINQTDALDEILRKKIEINKTREKMDKLEEELCDGGGAMFYFFTLGLIYFGGEEINSWEIANYYVPPELSSTRQYSILLWHIIHLRDVTRVWRHHANDAR